MRIYVFGDQAIRVEEQLLDLLHVKGCSILTTFLREATIAVQEAVAGLPPAERAAFPTVETLGFLLDAVKKGSSHVALDSALVCIYEIGYYIRYVAMRPPGGIMTAELKINPLDISNTRTRYIPHRRHAWWAFVRAPLRRLPLAARRIFQILSASGGLLCHWPFVWGCKHIARR